MSNFSLCLKTVFYPCHMKKNMKKNNPPPKSSRKIYNIGLEFGRECQLTKWRSGDNCHCDICPCIHCPDLKFKTWCHTRFLILVSFHVQINIWFKKMIQKNVDKRSDFGPKKLVPKDCWYKKSLNTKYLGSNKVLFQVQR